MFERFRAIFNDFDKNTPSGDRRGDLPLAPLGPMALVCGGVICLRGRQQVAEASAHQQSRWSSLPIDQHTFAGKRKIGASVETPTKFGIFCRNRRKLLEMARTHRQKAIQGLLSRFRWSPGGRIFDRFEPGSHSALFFQNSDQNICKIGAPGNAFSRF